MRRLPAILVGSLVPVLALGAVVAAPPVLETWILASGRTPSRVGWTVVSLILLAAAVVCAREAWGLWRRAPALDPAVVRRKLLAGLAGTAVAILAAEGAARLALGPEEVLWGDRFGRYHWMAQRASTHDASHSSPRDAADRYDADLGWAPREGYRSRHVNINANGERGTREHPPEAGDGRRRVVITGDSFTFGEDVSDGEVYTELVDAMLPGAEVINIAVHGYGTDQQYLRLRALGFRYRPDLVVLAYYRTNADRNVLTFRDYAKPRFRLVDGALRLENVPVPPPGDPSLAGDPPPIGCYLWELVRKNAGKLLAHTRFDPKWALTRAILDAALADCRAAGVPFALLYIPAARPDLDRVVEPPERVLGDWARERQVPMLDLRPIFLALPEESRRGLYDGHWTPEGHRAAARAVAPWIDGLLRKAE